LSLKNNHETLNQIWAAISHPDTDPFLIKCIIVTCMPELSSARE
jgi:hypothetical protein